LAHTEYGNFPKGWNTQRRSRSCHRTLHAASAAEPALPRASRCPLLRFPTQAVTRGTGKPSSVPQDSPPSPARHCSAGDRAAESRCQAHRHPALRIVVRLEPVHFPPNRSRVKMKRPVAAASPRQLPRGATKTPPRPQLRRASEEGDFKGKLAQRRRGIRAHGRRSPRTAGAAWQKPTPGDGGGRGGAGGGATPSPLPVAATLRPRGAIPAP